MSQGESHRPPADGPNDRAGSQAPQSVPAESPLPRMTRFSDPEETGAEEYRALSILAVVGLGLGLLSPLALLTPALWLVPAAGIAVCLWALQRIAQESPAPIGRKAALAGLWIAVACGSAAPVEWALHRWLVRGEAQQFALAYFDFLRKNEPHKAYQLTVHPAGRQPFDDKKLWDFYTGDFMRYREIQSFVQMPVVRTLLALGDKVQVRYYDTEAQGFVQEDELLKQVYAVTYLDAQGEKTFFVRLSLKRSPLYRASESFWRVDLVEGGVRPVALGGTLQAG